MIAATHPGTEEVWDWLSHVPDPEIPVISLTDLGIIRDVAWEGDTLVVTVTPTYSGCPATEVIEQNVLQALEAAGLGPVRASLQRAPAWSSDWISAEGRRKLREYGIAPPCTLAPGDPVPIRFTGRPRTEAVACPRCNSQDTERLSAFGSTACKALYRCLACREPFEYFKPI